MIIGDRVELNLFTTLKCNLRCSYCTEADGGSLGTQGDVSYSIEQLKKFVKTHADKKEVYSGPFRQDTNASSLRG